jgi:hypothetical protein
MKFVGHHFGGVHEIYGNPSKDCDRHNRQKHWINVKNRSHPAMKLKL